MSRPGPHGFSTRFEHQLGILEQVRSMVAEHQPTDLILPGDLTHRRHFISFKLYNPVWEHLYTIASMVRRTHIFPGNHDWEADGVHSLTPLKGLPYARVYDIAQRAHLGDGEAATFIPFDYDANVVTRAFERADSALPVVAHYAAAGAPLESDYWLDAPLKIGELARFPYVIFGHIHRPALQCTRCGATWDVKEWGRKFCPNGGLDHGVPPAIYCGAPMHFNFGDHGDRYALLVRNGDVKFLPFQAPVFTTCKWPRMPVPRNEYSGYLRVLDAPRDRLDDVREEALSLGWLDAVALGEALPPEMKDAVTRAMVLDEGLLRDYVRSKLPDLGPDEQTELVEEGLSYLRRARA